MEINLVKQLREMSGASVMECRNALEEAKGDLTKALEILKRKGQAIAAKKNERETRAGIIEAYIHTNAKIGVLLDLRCETDFVAKNQLFKELAHELALQIAAMAPQYISENDIPETVLDEEKAIYREELKNSGKPEKIIEQIIDGKLKKRFSEICLLDQPSIKNQDETVSDLIKNYIAKIGENIKAERFVRFDI